MCAGGPRALHTARRRVQTMTALAAEGTQPSKAPGVLPQILDELPLFKEWRRDFHAHPELGFQETRTAGLVAARLRAFGCDSVTTGVATTGVVGVIKGKKEGMGRVRSVGLRADMDALPLSEHNDFPHRSTVEGAMHACGHDGHTTMLLAAAKYLAQTRNFAGNVVLIFQPSEEDAGGAQVMCKEGLFERWPCDEVYGLHNWPELPLGKIGVKQGPLMAACDEFKITIRGVGGHAAMPHLSVDPVAIVCQIFTALQSMVARRLDPLDGAVLSVTHCQAGSPKALNVIAHDALLGGTVRSFSEETRQFVLETLKSICMNTATNMGGSAEVEIFSGYPATVNDAEQARAAAKAAVMVLGLDNVLRDADVTATMASEDFSYMLNERPGCYIFLGQAQAGEQGGGQGAGAPAGPAGPCSTQRNLHHPRYDFNDNALPIGASWFVNLVETRMPLSL